MIYVDGNTGATSDRTPRVLRLLLCIFGTLGALALAVAVAFGSSTQRFVKRAVEVPGTIDRIVPVVNGRGKVTYRPVFRFTTREGNSVVVASKLATNSIFGHWHAGDPAQVLYDPANPQHAEIHQWVRLWMTPTIFGVIGCVFFLACLAMCFLIFNGSTTLVITQQGGTTLQ